MTKPKKRHSVEFKHTSEHDQFYDTEENTWHF